MIKRPNEDRIWIDAERGVMRRRHCFLDNRLELSVDLRDYRQAAPGIWLPYEIERHHRGLKHHTIHRMESYQVNNVPDEAFAFEPPPGTLIHDRDTDRFEQVPGGWDFFEELIGRGLSRIEPRQAGGSLPVFPGALGFVLGLFALKGKEFACNCVDIGWKRPLALPVWRSSGNWR